METRRLWRLQVGMPTDCNNNGGLLLVRTGDGAKDVDVAQPGGGGAGDRLHQLQTDVPPDLQHVAACSAAGCARERTPYKGVRVLAWL